MKKTELKNKLRDFTDQKYKKAWAEKKSNLL